MTTSILNIILAILVITAFFEALIAYDCQGQQMNITTFNLIEIGKCKLPADQITSTREKIQLLQIRDVEMVPLYQCKIYVIRLITYCGMNSHISVVANGLATYIHPVSRDMCLEMHHTRRLNSFYNKNIDNLVINGTTSATVTMAGRTTGDGHCVGGAYEDYKERWENVIVQATIEITSQNRLVPANVNENEIYLPGGIVCPYKGKTCIDTIFGYSFRDYVNNARCSENQYTVLYEGEATRLTPMNISLQNYDTIIYSVDQGDTVFAMPIARPTMICGQSSYETEHPKFFIVRPSENRLFYFKKTGVDVFNMDPTTYTNAKVVFV